jgi:hypothetical protein
VGSEVAAAAVLVIILELIIVGSWLFIGQLCYRAGFEDGRKFDSTRPSRSGS